MCTWLPSIWLNSAKLLTLNLLSMNLATLSCPEGASSLSKLDIWYCRVAPGAFFTLTTAGKRCFPDQLSQLFSHPSLIIRDYSKNTPCISIAQARPFVYFYVKPHQPLSSHTLSRWLLTGLTNLGCCGSFVLFYFFLFMLCHARPYVSLEPYVSGR